MATIDMPLTMEFIAKTTGQRGNIYYIGHSLGTTIGLMYAAEFPEEASKYIRMFVFMAPAYTLSNMISPYKQIVPLVPKIWVRKMLQIIEFRQRKFLAEYLKFIAFKGFNIVKVHKILKMLKFLTILKPLQHFFSILSVYNFQYFQRL